MLKENVYNAVMEQLAPIVRKRLNEVSDELLMRAYNAGMQRNSGLEKRRARKFLDWLNDPRRKELKQPLTDTPKDKFELRKIIERDFRNQGTRLDLNYLDVSNVTDMSGLFAGLKELEDVRINEWDTSAVKSTAGMFYNCQSLRKVWMNNMDLSEVEDMHFMFARCHSLIDVHMQTIDTSYVRDMCGMFYMCSDLKGLDIRNWDISGVEDMSMMFYHCDSIQHILLPYDGTNALKSTFAMFAECSSLSKSINLGNWNTSKIVTARSMFSNCESLLCLNLYNWDLSNAKDVAHMFYGMKSLEKLYTKAHGLIVNSETDVTDFNLYGSRIVRKMPLIFADEDWPETTQDIVGNDGLTYELRDELGSRSVGSVSVPTNTNKRAKHTDDVKLFEDPKEVIKTYGCNPKEVMAIYMVIPNQGRISEYWPVLYYYINEGKMNARNAYKNYLRSLDDFKTCLELFKYEIEAVGEVFTSLHERVNTCIAYEEKGKKSRSALFRK